MADLRPFRGTRYNVDAIGDLSLVVAPPYDVIDEENRDYYYNKHPYNVIRLILNRPKKSDSSPDQPYVRAREFLDRWRAQRVLMTDTRPSLYLYRQRYLIEGDYKECTGIVARVRLEDFSEGGILPHEDIMPKPFEDRMKLLEYTRTNLSTVQSVYSDPQERLKEPILMETERFPVMQFQTEDGVAHDVWAVSDERFTSKIISFMRKRPLYIADGHHRYHTALEYSRRLQSSGDITEEDDPRKFLMMLIVEMENPGLSVLPVHRVVLGNEMPETEEFLHRLEGCFDVEELEVPRGPRSGQVYHVLSEMKRRGGSASRFVMFAREPCLFKLILLKPDVDTTRLIEGDQSPSYKRLDVSVLHDLILRKAMGIPADRASVEKNLVFTRDPLQAVSMVDSGKGKVAFLCNRTPVEAVRKIADEGMTMPQKSTYFYPKPCSGVVMNTITEW